MVRSLDYLNRRKVLYVYVDIYCISLIKVNGASLHLPVKS